MKRFAIPALAAAGIIATSIAIGSPQRPDATGGESSRFSVSVCESVSIKVDGRGGQTWVLMHPADKTDLPVWVPIETLPTSKLKDWHKSNEEQARLSSLKNRLQRLKDTGMYRLRTAEAEELEMKIAKMEAELAGE